MTVQQALAHPWIKGHAQLPDKPLSSIMLTRLKQFTQMSKLKCALALCIGSMLRCFAVYAISTYERLLSERVCSCVLLAVS